MTYFESVMVRSATLLALEKRLFDPSDDDILIYAAESAGISPDDLDLSTLDTYTRAAICGAYDAAV